MANLFDYLIWRGDVPLSVDPFREVDNLVLSEISYSNFDGIVPNAGFVTLKDASDKMFQIYTREELSKKTSFTYMAPFLLEQCVLTKRFGDILVGNYINEIDPDHDKQICALTFLLGDGSAYIAYRGTDTTLVGWKEDFLFSYRTGTNGQERALQYLEETAEHFGGFLRIGGHSKGGNFAVYAATQAAPSVRKKITEIYSNDGPGFRQDILKCEGYRELLDRMLLIVPESSIIGMLMQQDCRRILVKSSEKGIMQHDALSWQVLGNRFEYADKLTESGVFTDLTIRDWLIDIDDATRASFVDSLFIFLDAGWSEILEGGIEAYVRSARNMIGAMKGLPLEKRKEFTEILFDLFRSSNKVFWEEVRKGLKEGFETMMNNIPEF